jgi:hypothetical protein
MIDSVGPPYEFDSNKSVELRDMAKSSYDFVLLVLAEIAGSQVVIYEYECLQCLWEMIERLMEGAKFLSWLRN